MKISDLFASGKRLFSFEFFPPKTEVGATNLARTIRDLKELSPDFVSVTYGAGGSTRERTVDLVTRIHREEAICTMAHLTAVGAGRDELAALLDRLVEDGIQNMIPLRGDPPAEAKDLPPSAFAHASDLVAFIRQRYGNRLCLAGAGYPEGHPQSSDLARDMEYLARKVEAGIDFIITQLFFDNRHEKLASRFPSFRASCPSRMRRRSNASRRCAAPRSRPFCKPSLTVAAVIRPQPCSLGWRRRQPSASACSPAVRRASISTPSTSPQRRA
jgi:Methylenetetrahydrofolate reductase